MAKLNEVKDSLIDLVAMVVLNTDKETWDIKTMTEWRKGWLDGYTTAYKHLTGETVYQFVDRVNKSIEHSGHGIVL